MKKPLGRRGPDRGVKVLRFGDYTPNRNEGKQRGKPNRGSALLILK